MQAEQPRSESLIRSSPGPNRMHTCPPQSTTGGPPQNTTGVKPPHRGAAAGGPVLLKINISNSTPEPQPDPSPPFSKRPWARGWGLYIGYVIGRGDFRIRNCRAMVLEWVGGADFWCKGHSRTSPVVLEGFGDQVWPKIDRKPAKNKIPTCQ